MSKKGRTRNVSAVPSQDLFHLRPFSRKVITLHRHGRSKGREKLMSTRKEIRIPFDLNRRMELDAKMKNQTDTDWINQAIAHALVCKDMAPTQRLRIWITPVETACVKCHKKIPAFTQMMCSSTLGGGLSFVLSSTMGRQGETR